MDSEFKDIIQIYTGKFSTVPIVCAGQYLNIY